MHSLGLRTQFRKSQLRSPSPCQLETSASCGIHVWKLRVLLNIYFVETHLEFTGLTYQATIEPSRSLLRAAELSRQAVELAERHGWTDEPDAGIAYLTLGGMLAWQGKPEDSECWIRRAEGIVRAEADPTAGMAVHYVRGLLELVRGRDADALGSFQTAERLAGRLAVPHVLVLRMRALLVLALVRLGKSERAEVALAALEERERERGEVRIATAELRLAQGDPHAATAALAPVLDGSAVMNLSRALLILAFGLQASARDALGDQSAAGRALERALDLAEPDGALSPFLLNPAAGLLERHARQRTAHAALIADIQSLLAGRTPAPPTRPRPPLEPLSDSEVRVLRYLPTNLTGPEIASELYVSPNTVKTHLHHLYAKLGTHGRAEAVEHARALGLLAPSPHRGQATRLG
jgi:LuxR family transcriptional regulator, maltose regulon positive regulatory protein